MDPSLKMTYSLARHIKNELGGINYNFHVVMSPNTGAEGVKHLGAWVWEISNAEVPSSLWTVEYHDKDQLFHLVHSFDTTVSTTFTKSSLPEVLSALRNQSSPSGRFKPLLY